MPKKSPLIYPTISFVLIMGLWQLLSMKLDYWILPSPLKVLSVFPEAHSVILYHLQYTVTATLTGFGISIILGVVTAILMDASSILKESLYPYLIASQTVPIIAVAPLLIIWFGYGISSKIFTVVLVCFFPIALSFWTGLNSVDIEQKRLLKSMGASAWKTFRYLKFPSALPGLFHGLKLSATYSVMGAIIGEWLGGHGGLGIYMTRAGKSYLTHHIYAVVIVIVLLSLALFLLVTLIERLALAWQFQKKEEYKEIPVIRK